MQGELSAEEPDAFLVSVLSFCLFAFSKGVTRGRSVHGFPCFDVFLDQVFY